MSTTSKVIVRTVIKGTQEGGSAQAEYVMVNSTGCRVTIETTFGSGLSSATTFSTPTNAKFMTIIPPTSNAEPWRLAASTVEVGLAMSSQGASVFALSTASATTFYGYTTSTRAISGVRVIFS